MPPPGPGVRDRVRGPGRPGTGAGAAVHGRNVGIRRRGAGGGQYQPAQRDEDAKYSSHDRKVYAPAGFNSVSAAVGPISCPQPRNGARRAPVAEDHVALAGQIAEGLRDAGLADLVGSATTRPPGQAKLLTSHLYGPATPSAAAPRRKCHWHRRRAVVSATLEGIRRGRRLPRVCRRTRPVCLLRRRALGPPRPARKARQLWPKVGRQVFWTFGDSWSRMGASRCSPCVTRAQTKMEAACLLWSPSPILPT